MEDNNKLIPVNNSLVSIERQLTIGDKIIYQKIEELFNRAFKLINSKNIDTDSNYNYLADFLQNESLLLFEWRRFWSDNYENIIQALKIFDSIIELNNNFKLAYFFKGIIYGQYSDYKSEIVELFFNKFKLDKTEKLFYTESINNFSKVLEIDDKCSYALYQRIFLNVFEGDDLIALHDCNKLITLNPRCSDSYRIRGNILFSLGKDLDSLNDFKLSLELDPNNIRTYNNLGRAHLSFENFTLANKYFHKAIELASIKLKSNPNDPYLYYYIGYANIGIENFIEGQYYLRKSLDINSNFYYASELEWWVREKIINNQFYKKINDYELIKYHPLVCCHFY